MDRGFILKGDICYSQSPQKLAAVSGGYLVCVDGRSSGVYQALPDRFALLPVIDYTGKLIIPGLTDLHMHAPQFSYRALGMDLELLEWLNRHTFPEESKYSDIEYAARAYTALLDDLARGPNTRAVIFATVHLPATVLLMDMMEKTGLVSYVGKVNMDRNTSPGLQEESAARSLADTRAWLERTAGRYRNTSPILTPRFIPSCSDELMYGLSALQKEYGLPVQSHLSENMGEVEWVRELCPDSSSYADAYDSFSLFGGDVPTVMAHCVWNTDMEIELMRQRGVYVAHCPQSNMNLSSGIAPARRYLDKHIPMGLGSDVAGGVHTSIFRAMSDAIQASKLRWRLVDYDKKPLTLEEAFYLGTAGGGSFFGRVGSFEECFELDALIIDDSSLSAPFELEITERLTRVVYLSDDRHILHKYVRGMQLF